MKRLKLLVVLGLATITGVGATMLAPQPAEAIPATTDCPANHQRCVGAFGGCTGALMYNCDWDGVSGACTTTWYGNYPGCQT